MNCELLCTRPLNQRYLFKSLGVATRTLTLATDGKGRLIRLQKLSQQVFCCWSYLLGIALYYAFLSVDKSSSRHDRCTWESDVLPMLKSCFPCQSWIGRSKWLINKKMLVDKTGESFAKPHHLQLPGGSQQQIWRMAISLRAHSWDGECRCNTRDLVEWKGRECEFEMLYICESMITFKAYQMRCTLMKCQRLISDYMVWQNCL